MRRSAGRLVAAVLPLSLALALVASGAAGAVDPTPTAPETSADHAADPGVDLPRPVRGATAIRMLGDGVTTDGSGYPGSASTAENAVVADPDVEAEPAPTTTGLTSVVTGRSVRLTAVVTADGSSPDGMVLFAEDGLDLAMPVHLTDGAASFTRPAASVGDHVYTATFLPADPAAYAGSLSPDHLVTVLPAATTTTLAGTVKGTTVTLSTQVSALGEGPPPGTVEFLEGSTVVGSAALVAGRATLVLTGVAIGRHTYQVRFTPAGTDHVGSQSGLTSITVPAASKTTLKAPTKAKKGSRPVVTVKVTRGTAAATGSVVLKYGARTKTLTLRRGSATFKLPAVKKGRLKLTATYRGNTTTRSSTATRTIKVR